MRLRVRSLALLSCRELWCRSQRRLGSCVAVALAWTSSYSSDSTPSLKGKKTKKKKKKKKLKKVRIRPSVSCGEHLSTWKAVRIYMKRWYHWICSRKDNFECGRVESCIFKTELGSWSNYEKKRRWLKNERHPSTRDKNCHSAHHIKRVSTAYPTSVSLDLEF